MVTAFTISELLGENQQRGITLPPHIDTRIRVNKILQLVRGRKGQK